MGKDVLSSMYVFEAKGAFAYIAYICMQQIVFELLGPAQYHIQKMGKLSPLGANFKKEEMGVRQFLGKAADA